ncbi:NAD(+) synthase [Rubrimonas cliftonensis]|uniref:Glutamine-dependent NAD(+) synthetase n=1 Tax=Rubrimonas cliftonensis TaxID=89524 RepID=A0A1H4CX12_9RHOB|nr:NAD(+) synthase [Rubrimonas cliftonensis]SEA64870.1 NAD+ synthase (glutamine-hydrolysing) [Rubrimonas cliftonensis]
MTLAPPPGFFNAHDQGFVRCAVAAPKVTLADPAANAEAIAALAETAAADHVAVLLTPELGLSGYAIDDLLHQDALLNAVEAALAALAARTAALGLMLLVGAPLRLQGRLHNCAVALHRGRVLGVVPKSYLPNYREFYEARWFAPAAAAAATEITVAGQTAPFGADLIFEAEDVPGLAVALEICEDVWVPVPPSALACMAGATVVANLSASNATVGKSEFRHALCEVSSARQICAYLYSAAGEGESTTDLAWDGQAMIYDLGEMLAETPRFARAPQMITADVDIERLQAERLRATSFAACARETPGATDPARWRRVRFSLDPVRVRDVGLRRAVARFPFVPASSERLDALCAEAYAIQTDGLRQRLEASGVKRVVIGVSGGLDSTQALLVAAQAMERLGRPRSDILAYTLPAFATSAKTKATAWALMRALGVTAREVDMTPSCVQMLRDIGHPAADGAAQYDLAYENVQAGARTSFLFRAAGHEGALVVGTGDLSEAALGWCTYGVGDHMSHYNPNASIPKTLIQHLIRWEAARAGFGAEVSAALRDVLATEISPELVPGEGEGPGQRTEDFVGPYALQDFNLYHVTRYGMRPSRVAFLAWHAWRDAQAGAWPPGLPEDQRRAYDLEEIARWLRVFLSRFFGTSQYKRSAMPNGPKLSSGGALSPRGDWRAPSDAGPAVWLAELEARLGAAGSAPPL